MKLMKFGELAALAAARHNCAAWSWRRAGLLLLMLFGRAKFLTSLCHQPGKTFGTSIKSGKQRMTEEARNHSKINNDPAKYMHDYHEGIEDLTQTDHVTNVAVAEVNKLPPPLVGDEQTRSREPQHLQAKQGVLFLMFWIVGCI